MKNNISLRIRQRPGSRLIHDLRLRLDHRAEPPETGKALLQHFGQFDQNLDRADKDSDIDRGNREVPGCHISPRDKPAAKHERRKVHHADKERRGALKSPHRLIISLLGLQECLVPLFEFHALQILVGESLHYADSRKRVVQGSIDIADFAAVVHECFLHCLILPQAHDEHCHGYREQNQSQLPFGQKEKYKRAGQLNQ